MTITLETFCRREIKRLVKGARLDLVTPNIVANLAIQAGLPAVRKLLVKPISQQKTIKRRKK